MKWTRSLADDRDEFADALKGGALSRDAKGDVEGILLTTLPESDRGVNWIELSDQDDWLVSTSSDGQIFGWNLTSQSREGSQSATTQLPNIHLNSDNTAPGHLADQVD